MKRSLHTIVVSLTALWLSAFGVYAIAADVANIMQMERVQLQADRKMIIAQAMQLSSAEGEKFWPLYDDYAAARKQNGDRLQKVILEYAKHFPEVPDAVATKLMDDWLATEKQGVKLKTKYVKKFRRVLTPQQLARYFQTENKLDAIVKFGLAADIPLIEMK